MSFKRNITPEELERINLIQQDPLATYEGTVAVYIKHEHRDDGLFWHGERKTWLECAECVHGSTPHAHLVIVAAGGVGMRCEPQCQF